MTAETDRTLFGEDLFGRTVRQAVAALAERFTVPPFTVLDARQGYWQERKGRWSALGIESELGRGENLAYQLPEWADRGAKGAWKKSPNSLASMVERNQEVAPYVCTGPTSKATGKKTGTSIFDPVLCEAMYRWFCPAGGTILDPFAGGSVRGIVAAVLGRAYVGVDLSGAQVAANLVQGERICGPRPEGDPEAAEQSGESTAVTPWHELHVGGATYYLKRDDAFIVAGVRGGKARTCWALAQGAKGLITAGARHSPQVAIVARIAEFLGIPCRVHVPAAKVPTPEITIAKELGAEVIEHKPGYNTVIVSRASKDYDARVADGWRLIPFGMECAAAVEQTATQVADLPWDKMERLVVPVGSGMTLAGILRGMKEADKYPTNGILGVIMGAEPEARLDEYAPDWRALKERGLLELVPSGIPYEKAFDANEVEGITLDPIYEAKCLPFMKDRDCLWVVGIRPSLSPGAMPGGDVLPAALTSRKGPDLAVPGHPTWLNGDSLEIDEIAPGDYDMVFSCPPYADLERYSDDPKDLSTMAYEDFLEAYRGIIAKAVSMLKQDRFAAFVVGDLRDKKGHLRGFIRDTIAAFEDAGAKFYNEAVLVTSVGSLPVRTGYIFASGRKMGKGHQNVLVFVKGDWKRAAEACEALDKKTGLCIGPEPTEAVILGDYTGPEHLLPGVQTPFKDAIDAADAAPPEDDPRMDEPPTEDDLPPEDDDPFGDDGQPSDLTEQEAFARDNDPEPTMDDLFA